MDQPIVTPWYVSRLVDLSCAHAAAALDELVDQRRRDGRVLLQLTSTLVAQPTSACLGTARRLHGRLRLPRSRPSVRVELELVPWSSSHSELALRPVRPPVARATRYWATAASTLERLRGELVAVADHGTSEPALRRAS